MIDREGCELTVCDAGMRPGHPLRIEGHEGHPGIFVLVLGHDDDSQLSSMRGGGGQTADLKRVGTGTKKRMEVERRLEPPERRERVEGRRERR